MSSNQQITNLKGFRDILPADAKKREWLRAKTTTIFKKWGFEPMETPTLEPLELFAGQIGEDEKLFFNFTDNGGRRVALRYDQTVPTCRVLGQYQNELVFPFKRYQIQAAFRAEKPQKGRYREFTQCDADIFGVEGPTADAEVIALGLDIYRQLGFKRAQVLINDRSLLADMPYEAIVAIDKIKKIGQEGVIADMVKKGIKETQARAYLEKVLNLKPNQTIQTILDYLKACGFPEDWYAFEPTIARSFSYSMGPIWEIVIPESSGGSVLGGERFDGLVEKITGRKIPGTGFGLGFDRTLEAAEEMGLVPDFAVTTQVLVAVFDDTSRPNALEAAMAMRRAGVNVDVYPQTDKLAKQFKFANKRAIPFVAIIGEEEIRQKLISLKDMVSGEQQQLTLTQVIEKIQA
ncbi:MAG: histidine--tRNA ligase [Patescibacteria group bacterium]